MGEATHAGRRVNLYRPRSPPRSPEPCRAPEPRLQAHSHYLAVSLLAAAASVAMAAAGAPAALDEPIKPIPLTLPVDAPRVALGKALFADRRLARDNSVACVSCHIFDKGGAFPGDRPTGAGGRRHVLNSPSVFNVALNFRQLWSGAAENVEAVVDVVVKSPLVFDSNWNEVMRKLSQDAALAARFRQVYRDGLTPANVQNALGEYTRSLTTPNAPFDKFLRGDANAIGPDEKAGYLLFKKYGCVACHQGVNVGGNMYQSFGVMGDYFRARGNVTEADFGRFNATAREADRFVFKVPSLRNVALTAPYFHDGSAANLNEAVDVMFKYQLGRAAPQGDKELIVKFLATLTGEAPAAP
jgi:cytochrome c peroxidase